MKEEGMKARSFLNEGMKRRCSNNTSLSGAKEKRSDERAIILLVVDSLFVGGSMANKL